MNPYERIHFRKEIRNIPDFDPLVKWKQASDWLEQFDDSDQWAIVWVDGDRSPCVSTGFVLECVWRSHWVAFDEVEGYQRLVTGFGELPETLPQTGTPENYSRGAWVFEAQNRDRRRKPLSERRAARYSETDLKEPSPLDLSMPVGECNPQQLMEAMIRTQGCWNCFNPNRVLDDLHQHPELWINFMMLPLIAESERSNRLFSNLGLALRDLGHHWHADTLYVWSRNDDCVYPLVDFGKVWCADDVQVMDRDRASLFIGYGGASDPPPVVIYWWD